MSIAQHGPGTVSETGFTELAMAMSLEGRLKWRRTAPFHVQLELEKPHAIQTVSDVHVQGRAVRVFRTDGRLAVGDRVAFALWVCRAGDEPTGPAYIYYDDFKAARHMEAYLFGEPPECKLAAYEFNDSNSIRRTDLDSAPVGRVARTIRQLMGGPLENTTGNEMVAVLETLAG